MHVLYSFSDRVGLYSFPDRVGSSGIGSIAFHQIREAARNGIRLTPHCESVERTLPDEVRVVQTMSLAGRKIPHRVVGIDRAYRHHHLGVAAALKGLDRVDALHCWPRASIRTSRAATLMGIPALREVPNTHTAHAFEVVAREFESLGLRPERGHSHTFDTRALAREETEYRLACARAMSSSFPRSRRAVPS